MIPISIDRKIVASLAVGLWLATAVSLPVAFGQESAPASPPADSRENLTSIALTIEAVDAQIQRIEAATDLAEATRSTLLSHYTEARVELRVAATSAAAATQFEQQRQQAPSELAEIQARLDQARTQPAPQPVADAPADASLEVLTERLRDAETELKARTEALRLAEDDLRKRTDRQSVISTDLEAANSRLDEVTRALAAPTAAGVDSAIAAARQTLLSARRQAAEQQIRTYNEERRYWEAMIDLLSARRDDARVQVAAAEAAVTAWRTVVTERRQVEAEEQRRQAQTQFKDVPPPARALLESNSELAGERLKLATDIEHFANQSRDVTREIESLERKLADLREQDQTAGMRALIGPLLLQEQQRLPDVNTYRRQVRALENQASAIQRRLFELRELRAKLTDIDEPTSQLLQEVKDQQPTIDAEEIEGAIRDILRMRLELVRSLQRDYEESWNRLAALNLLNKRFVARANDLAAFINERILWVRSHPPLHRAALPGDFISTGSTWRTILRSLGTDARERPGAYLAMGTSLLLWLGLWRAMRNRLRRIDRRVADPHSDAAGLTLQALCLEALLVAPIPAVMLFLGGRLKWAVPLSDLAANQFAQALAAGLIGPATAIFITLLLWRLYRPGGIGEVQFRWGEQATCRLHRPLLRLVLIGGLAAFLSALAGAHPDSGWRDLVARGAFYMAILMGVYIVHVHLHPRRGAIAMATGKASEGKLRSPVGVRYLLAMAIVIAPAGISAAGYHFTAVRLGQNVARTFALIIALVIFRALILRFVRVSLQKAAIIRAREEAARRAAERAKGDDHGAEPAAIQEEVAFEVPAVDQQIFTLVRWAVVFTLVIGIWAVWNDIFPAFSFLGRIELWSYTVVTASGAGAEPQVLTSLQPVFLSDLLVALILGVGTVVLTKNLPGMLELVLFARLSIEPSIRFAATTLGRYAIVIVGLLVAFGSIGIGWHQVQFLAAAITVGLGFGLQEIFANFVSGLIILFERPIRIGDLITVGDASGIVTRIRIRATTVRDFEQKELMIPNKELITGRLLNWTLSDATTRVLIKVGIAYGSDVERAIDVLLELAREDERVLTEPAPGVVFDQFADSSLNLAFRVFVGTLAHRLPVMTDMHRKIHRRFAEEGITIAFPQRDIHVRSIHDTRLADGASTRSDEGGNA